MTLNTALVTRVRSNINEDAAVPTPRRTDAEILQWLQDAQLDYVGRVPHEQFPELISSQTFSGGSVSIPADYFFFFLATVTHTLSGTYTGIDDCFQLGPGESYLRNNYPSHGLGAWAQLVGATMEFGPNCISGTLSYIKRPADISTGSVTFTLGVEHESAIVEYATSMALAKVNDTDAQAHMDRYDAAIKSKGGDSGEEAKEIERA